MAHNDEARMDHDRSAIRAAFLYGRHFFEFWQSDLNRAVVELADIQPDMTVLDIGAGMGAAAFEAVKGDGVMVVTVEPTAFMRTILKARVASRRHESRIAILNAGAQHLPVPTDSIDRGWMINVVHHVGDLAEASAELARVTKPGGRILIVDEDFTNESHPKYEQMKNRHKHHGGHGGGEGYGHGTGEAGHDDGVEDHPMAIDFEQLAEHLATAGFSEIQVQYASLAGVPTRQAMAVK